MWDFISSSICRAETEAVLRALLGADYPNRPVYVICESELPHRFANAYSGLAWPGMDLALRPWIQNWQGRGPAILVNDRTIRRDTVMASVFETGDQTRLMYFRATALHECCHWFDWTSYVFDDNASEGTSEGLRQTLANTATESFEVQRPAMAQQQAIRPPFDQHTGTFLRACIHASRRAVGLGWALPLGAVVQPEFYGLSSIELYRAALGDEPERMTGCSFAKIRSTKPPQAFVALWQQDVRRWFCGLPEHSAATAAMSHQALNVFPVFNTGKERS